MKIIKQSHEIICISKNILQNIEFAGRTCYKSEDRITPDSAEKFVKTLISREHTAMIEFGDITIKFITNRNVTHELVRHRLCSFAQESTRYCSYAGEIVCIRPVWLGSTNYEQLKAWTEAMHYAEYFYNKLLRLGWRLEQAREVLPNSLKTEIAVKANIREWRHIFKLRTSKQAHPQIKALMQNCLDELKTKVPIVFEDI